MGENDAYPILVLLFESVEVVDDDTDKEIENKERTQQDEYHKVHLVEVVHHVAWLFVNLQNYYFYQKYKKGEVILRHLAVDDGLILTLIEDNVYYKMVY